MLKRVGIVHSPVLRWSQRFFHQSHRSRAFITRNASTGALVSSSLVAGAVLFYSANRVVYGDGLFSVRKADQSVQLPQVSNATFEGGDLNVIVWGSNKENLLSPETPEIQVVKTPSVTNWLRNVALRDIALHKKHAACVDVRGDVYQWGEGFNHPNTTGSVSGPILTLRGKNIVRLQSTASRVFALSASGRIYVLNAVNSQAPVSPRDSWWPMAWLFGKPAAQNIPEIIPHVHLRWGEKFVSISAGDDHLLALTATGRTFAHPITADANTSGQLGFRKFEITDGRDRRVIELSPKAARDPLANATAFVRRKARLVDEAPEKSTWKDDNQEFLFSDRLYEIPALKGIHVSQIATAGRSSYVRTSDGKVLGWGANEYGQIGLGNNVILDTITVPTEIVLWRTAADHARTKCLDISAGGDLACFTVERSDDEGIKTVDLLVCGNGQWGGLGTGLFSNAQGTPMRAKNISGLFEYCESSKTRKALTPHAVSVSPTGHVLLTLDTLTRSTTTDCGRDLYLWGENYEYALGNGKRGSSALPSALETAGGERFMLRQMRAKEVRDLSGSVWKRRVLAEQRAVAGYGNSVVYWRIVERP